MSDTAMHDAGADPSSAASGPNGTADPGGKFAWLERFATPVFVKEIRQAQRGRVFAIALVVTLAFAVFATVVSAIAFDGDNRVRAGTEFFSAVYFFLCASVLVVVPFQAFVSMGSEWDDNTFEMLVLSNLSPRQIVLGKLMSSGLQGMLFFACFAPFMAVAFLLRGVDVVMLTLILALTAYACLWFSTVSIMVSTLVRKRFLRVLVMVGLAGGLMLLLPASSGLAAQWIRRPDIIADSEFFIFLGQFLLGATVMGVVSFCIACNLLAHEEENRSTNLRVLTTVGVLSLLGMMAFNVLSPSVRFEREDIFVGSVFCVFGLGFLCTFFGYEPDRLGRRVEPTVPRSKLLATLITPWLPGGGRGALFLVLHLGMVVVGAFWLSILLQWAGTGPSGSGRYTASADGIFDDGGWGLLLSCLYVVLYTICSMAVLHGYGTNPHRRNIMRAITLSTPVIYVFLPAVVGLFLRDRDLTSMRHIGNPGLLIGDNWSRFGRHEELVLLLLAATFVGFIVHFPRFGTAIEQVRRASEKNGKVAEQSAAGTADAGAA